MEGGNSLLADPMKGGEKKEGGNSRYWEEEGEPEQ